MAEDGMVTGLGTAVLVDCLLGLGVGVDDVLAMSHAQRLTLLQAAIDDGRIPSEQATGLLELVRLP